MFQLCHDHKSMNSFQTCSSVTNSTIVNGPCLEIVGMKPLHKAITLVLIVFMAHPSPIQNSITDSVKAEQRGWWWFTRRAGAVRFLAAGELSLSLSLSLSNLGIWILNVFFYFSFFPKFSFKFEKKKKNHMQNGVILVGLTAAFTTAVTEPWINKNWKLEDWNEKMWK